MSMSTIARKFTNKSVVSALAVAVIAVVVSATVMISGSAQAAGPRPFKGNAEGIFDFVTMGGSGTLDATHIGKGEVVFSGLAIDFGAGTVPDSNVPTVMCFPVSGGDQTFTAANGDEITTWYDSGEFCADVSGGPNVPPMPVYGNFVTTVTGGTGRFEDATGTINIHATAGYNGTDVTFESHFGSESTIEY